jgi:hypothetical protein
MGVYTAFIAWGDKATIQRKLASRLVDEEIDVKARDAEDARRLAQAELDRDYEAGGEIVHIEGPRVGLYH